MAKFDLRAVGITAGVTRHRVAASVTRGLVGEPLEFLNVAHSSGATDTNTVTACADANPVIGTDQFVGICSQDFEVDSAAAVTAHYSEAVSFIPFATKVRGKAKTAGNLDVQSELTNILDDITQFDLTSSTYTIDETATANTGALTIVDGDINRNTLDCVVDGRAIRDVVT